jgi:hypothetical protein
MGFYNATYLPHVETAHVLLDHHRGLAALGRVELLELVPDVKRCTHGNEMSRRATQHTSIQHATNITVVSG